MKLVDHLFFVVFVICDYQIAEILELKRYQIGEVLHVHIGPATCVLVYQVVPQETVACVLLMHENHDLIANIHQ